MNGIGIIRKWLAESYEERGVEIHVVCDDAYGLDDSGPQFSTVVILSEVAYSGPAEPASTGDHSQSVIQHTGFGADLDEAVHQAITQWRTVKGLK